MKEIITHAEPWLTRSLGVPKTLLVIACVVLAAIAMMSFGNWPWAVPLSRAAVFNAAEDAIY